MVMQAVPTTLPVMFVQMKECWPTTAAQAMTRKRLSDSR
jgi:hypothetical protein